MLTTDTDTKPVALITGAAGSLGRSIAEAFHRNGYRLALLDRRLETLRETAATIDGQSLLLEADLGEATEVLAATQATLERWRRIDVLCNVAGGFRWEIVEDGDIGVAHRLERHGGECGPSARAAHHDHPAARIEGLGVVGTGRVGEGFEHASGDLDRAVDVAVLALLGLSHIEQHGPCGDLRRSVHR